MQRRITVKTFDRHTLTFWSSDKVKLFRRNLEVFVEDLRAGDVIEHDGKPTMVMTIVDEIKS